VHARAQAKGGKREADINTEEWEEKSREIEREVRYGGGRRNGRPKPVTDGQLLPTINTI